MEERDFDDFYTASFQRINGQLYALVGDRDEAQECVQEAFVRAWAHRGKLDRAAVSRWRRTSRARRPPAAARGPAPSAGAPPPRRPVGADPC